MQSENKNKEHFKLLQYSDDSKSLSDLELTEIVVPRKRKVRRKTKPKNGHRHRKQQLADGSSGGSCKNIGIWVAIASTVCWLLILSYIAAVLSSEYAAFDKQQAKTMATIKTMPEEWHDKAHVLEGNQSALFHSLFDLQQKMKNLTDDFMELRVYMNQQQAQANELGPKGILGNLANFGASLKALENEIDTLKNRSLKHGDMLAEHTQAIDYFRSMVVQKRLNDTESVPKPVEDPQNKIDIADLRNISQVLNDRLDRINASVSAEHQKADELERSHTEKINDLRNSVANITKPDVNSALEQYQDQIASLDRRIVSLEHVAETLEQNRNAQEVKSQQEGLNAALNRLQSPAVKSRTEDEQETKGANEAEKPEGQNVM